MKKSKNKRGLILKPLRFVTAPFRFFNRKFSFIISVITLYLINYFAGGIFNANLFYLLVVPPIFSFFYTLLVAKFLKVSTEVSHIGERITNNTNVFYVVKIKTPFNLPISLNRLKVDIKCKSKLITHSFNKKLKLSLNDKAKKLIFPVSFKTKGQYEIELRKINVIDFFDIIKFKNKFKIKTNIKVYPRAIRIENYELKTLMNETNIENTNTKGDQYFSVREFIKGDPINKIHWKLSHKFRKQFSKIPDNLSKQTRIFYDNRLNKNLLEVDKNKYDQYISEVLISVTTEYLLLGYAVEVKHFVTNDRGELAYVSNGNIGEAFEKLSFLPIIIKPTIELTMGSIERGEEYVYISSLLDETTMNFIEQMSGVASRFVFYYVPIFDKNYNAQLEKINNITERFNIVIVDSKDFKPKFEEKEV